MNYLPVFLWSTLSHSYTQCRVATRDWYCYSINLLTLLLYVTKKLFQIWLEQMKIRWDIRVSIVCIFSLFLLTAPISDKLTIMQTYTHSHTLFAIRCKHAVPNTTHLFPVRDFDMMVYIRVWLKLDRRNKNHIITEIEWRKKEKTHTANALKVISLIKLLIVWWKKNLQFYTLQQLININKKEKKTDKWNSCIIRKELDREGACKWRECMSVRVWV